MVVTQEIGEDNQSPPEWLGEIEPTFLSYESVPLFNFPFFNEVICVQMILVEGVCTCKLHI